MTKIHTIRAFVHLILLGTRHSYMKDSATCQDDRLRTHMRRVTLCATHTSPSPSQGFAFIWYIIGTYVNHAPVAIKAWIISTRADSFISIWSPYIQMGKRWKQISSRCSVPARRSSLSHLRLSRFNYSLCLRLGGDISPRALWLFQLVVVPDPDDVVDDDRIKG